MFAGRNEVIGKFTRALSILALALCAVVLTTPALHAQVTTGNIAGTVTDQTGAALPGVTVEAIHEPTGTRYQTVSEVGGRFVIPNVRVGGPYKLTATLEGFKPTTQTNLNVNLGTTIEVPVKLALASVSEAITVTAKTDEIINPGHTGSTSAVQEQQIQALPTVNRSLQDFARTNPYFVINPSDPTATGLTVAGRNNRYNNIQIDGAVNNDLFGLASTGTPGGQSNAQPISIDAIDQLQLVVSPYDVRQGGFTGGGVNAVTKSGANKYEGSVYGTKRHANDVGRTVPIFDPAKLAAGIGNGTYSVIGDKPISNFDYTQYGSRLGGPIVKDKLFFFVNGERVRRAQPTGTSADGSTSTKFSNSVFDTACGSPGCSAGQLRQDLITKYNYDPGPLGDIPENTPSDLAFVRFDFNANANNNVTLRHNYVKGSDDVIASRTSTQFRFPTSTYIQANKTNSSVAQINSVFSASAFNEGRITYQTIKDLRQVPVVFPSIEIGGANQNATLNAGTERFSGANSLDQKIIELTDDYTWVKGNHTIVIGTHNELFHFKNVFLSEFYGYYFYPTLSAFETQTCPVIKTGTGCEYRLSYGTGADAKAPTAFGAQQYGLYASDQWHLNNNLSLTYGLRLDKPRFNDTPNFNPLVQTALGFNTAAHPGENTVISPRIGFNWTPGDNKQQVRGGVGIFAGRTPYVWISNAYAGTGVQQIALACRAIDGCQVPAFNADPNNQPRTIAGAVAPPISVDLVDPNFKFPRVLRATLGYDRDLWWGIRGTVEALYSKTQEDVYYQNLNYVQTGTSPLDGRPTYTRATSSLVDATFLTNTSKGSETLESLQLTRPFTHGVTLSGFYAHQKARSAFDATSSRAISNWRFQHSMGDIFTPTLGTSAFEQKHRFNVNATWEVPTGAFTHTLGLFYNAQSGRPYSILMGGDPNKDTNTSNDLLYIPGSTDAFILCSSGTGNPTATNPCGTGAVIDGNVLKQYLSAAGLDPDKARIINKYESYEPWSRHLDFHYGLALPTKIVKTELSFDMLNLLHWMNSNLGNVYFVSNQNVTPVNYLGQDSASGKPIYRAASSTSLVPGRQFSIADIQSRWQFRMGLRLSF